MTLPRSLQPSPPQKFLSLWMESNHKNGNRNHFFLDNGRIIGKVSISHASLAAELAWLLHLRSRTDPSDVMLPRPLGPVVEDSGYFCMYLSMIQGQNIEQWIERNGILSDELALKVVNAYLALRAVPPSSEGHLLPGGLEWPVMGQIFNEDNEADCVVSTCDQFYAMMDERFHVAIGAQAKLPRAKVAFAHGDISPTDILLTSNDRIAFLDFGMSAWIPEYWDGYVLTRDQCSKPPGFLEPIRRVFAEKGILLGENDPTRRLLQMFDNWSKSREGQQYLRSLRPGDPF